MRVLLAVLALMYSALSGASPSQAKPLSVPNSPGVERDIGVEPSSAEQPPATDEPKTVSQELIEARIALKGIRQTATQSPALGDEGRILFPDEIIDGMSAGELRTATIDLARRSVASLTKASEGARQTSARSLPGLLETIQSELEVALAAVERDDERAYLMSMAAVEATLKEAREAINASSGSNEFKATLATHLRSASVAFDVVEESHALVQALPSTSGMNAPVQGEYPLNADPLPVSGGNAALDLIIVWLPAGLLVLYALGMTLYVFVLRRELRRLQKQGSSLDTQLKTFQQDCNKKAKEINMLRDKLEVARGDVAQKRSAIMQKAENRTVSDGTNTAELEQSFAIRKPSRIPELKRELDAYLAEGGKLRSSPYRDILASFGTVYGIEGGADGSAILQPDDLDPQRHVTAVHIDGTSEIAIVPSAYFISKFSMQFSRQLELSEQTKSFFEIQASSTSGLSIESIGKGELTHGEAVSNLVKGSLGGFI